MVIHIHVQSVLFWNYKCYDFGLFYQVVYLVRLGAGLVLFLPLASLIKEIFSNEDTLESILVDM